MARTFFYRKYHVNSHDHRAFRNRHGFHRQYRKCSGMRLAWIDEQLEAHGMSRRELAARIGLTEAQMSKVMGGSRKLSADEADAIRRVFGYSTPDNPEDPDISRIYSILSQLGERQRRAVVLYLEALAGDGE
ncbi:helix-turn-helix transcriptional regulator [Rhodovulum visakhapatnamense]|uniref:Helix-turn-helix transcriptional regulator n=2 Tax=Rhodovulum visakhapatnamense TaxID=364297 RepID=A0ABS1RPS4_9RHOB|nr:helix-turn-helix transcriptional regulator [Rhodovulum visakhapatnamense]